jgi:uncharacterized protein YqhQ
MNKLGISAKVTAGMGVLFILALIFSFLALTDIWHDIEPNLNLEWNVVRVSFLIESLFFISVAVTLAQVFRYSRRQEM